MSNRSMACPMCGHYYDPAVNLSCQKCPLHNGCQMVCCPACGFQTVDTDKSILARLADRWLFAKGQKNHHHGVSTDEIFRS